MAHNSTPQLILSMRGSSRTPEHRKYCVGFGVPKGGLSRPQAQGVGDHADASRAHRGGGEGGIEDGGELQG